GDRLQRVLGDGETDVLHLEQALILLDESVLQNGEDLHQRRLVEILERGNYRQSADELGNQAKFQQIFGLDTLEDVAGAAFVGSRDLGGKSDRGAAIAPRDDLLKARKRTTTDEEDVGGVDLQKLLLGVLAATLRRHGRDRPLHDLQQRLLHALARHVAGDGWVVRLAADLIDLVDVDDAALRSLDVVVGILQELQNDVLDILTNVACFRKRSGVRHREGHVKDARQRLGEQGLAAAGRSNEQDVGL